MTELILGSLLPGLVGGSVKGFFGVAKNVWAKKQTFIISKLFYSLIVAIIAGGLASVIIAQPDWRISLLAGYLGVDLIESLAKILVLKKVKHF